MVRLVIAALLAAPATAAAEPDTWTEVGLGYSQGEGAKLPGMVLVGQRSLDEFVSIAGELELSLPMWNDGGLLFGVGLALALPLSEPRVYPELAEPGRAIRTSFELVLRATSGFAMVYNDLSEGYIPTSDDSFQTCGLYARGIAGARWRLDTDGGPLDTVAIGVYPTLTAIRGESWLVLPGASLAVTLGY